jgi:copper chaperone CopZ
MMKREVIMSKVSLNVQKQFCEECSLALRRFIGGMEGVDSIAVQNGKIEIDYDSSKITEDTLKKLSKDSLEKLGYKLLDE